MSYTIRFHDNIDRPLASVTDEALKQAIKDQGLWVHGEYYPDFTICQDGEVHGGDFNSGMMLDPPAAPYPHLRATLDAICGANSLGAPPATYDDLNETTYKATPEQLAAAEFVLAQIWREITPA